MDLRLVIHRGLTLTIAILISLAPVIAILALFWPRLSDHLTSDELVGLLLGMIAVSLLIPPIRDITGRLLDRYVYRTRTNYQRTVREASRALTRVLDLKMVLSFVARPVAESMQAEGTGVYLQSEEGFALAIGESHRAKATFILLERLPEVIGEALRTLKEPLVTDELGREALTDDQRRLYDALIAHDWALLLPLLSEDAALGVVVVGPKLSGDPFFPHDLDLLMTLANQAGIAIKNAQLYTQVVLANEYVRNIVATIQSGVTAVDAVGRVTIINPAAERLAYFEMFAPSIAHEIKNPLVAIKTFAQLVPRRHHEPRFREDFSRVVTREIARIERLLERLRTMSRSTDRLPQRLDIRVPIVDAAEFLQAGFDEKRIGLVLDLGAEPRFVIGDHGEIEQLFINLLINGLEATPPEGSVVITVLATDTQVAVTVTDTGPGIPAESLEQVFEPFFSTRQRGSGLGLTICAAIAASHRAKLRAANRHGGGAVFTVEFPAVAVAEASAHK
jgi:signal transduction histidine kinase